MQITQYASTKKPQVEKITTLESVLNIIKNGDDNQRLIEAARLLGKENQVYTTIKTEQLPTFRFNFLFKDSAANSNIISPTGLIYLDCDDVEEIPDSPYILASWKSISNTGFGLLVRVDGLTLDNYKETYNELSKLIGIDSDAGARKATQQTIQSFDPELNHNPDALVYICKDIKNPSCVAIKKEEKYIVTNDGFLYSGDTSIRFDNINDYFTDDTPYIVFDEKIMICKPYIKLRNKEGKRNTTMYYLLSQYALLNPHTSKAWLTSIANSVNEKMYPKLSAREIKSVVTSIYDGRAKGILKLHFNEERRILFNPNVQMTFKEKMHVVNNELGHMKIVLTLDAISLAIDNWDFEANGKITQLKLVDKAGRSEKTIQRYWKRFKERVKEINNDFLASTKTSANKPKVNGIHVEQYIINLKCKYLYMNHADEAFLRRVFGKGKIEYSTDIGFKEIHIYMIEHLESKRPIAA
ncbi:BT4734/BF3469 family protein [Flavobacterium psychrotrophum]|uniref:BT4734/BF3469 family protein n=1 Tax=Flavobacterium psychrotrophum TaxID=2294119 RepID=UPI000E31F3D7|nr:BT4734/BF3469 family protein [Flavobacterium psychrotrophum]